MEGAEDTWAPSELVQPLQVHEEGNGWKMVSVPAPFSLPWLSFHFKNKERGHVALFKALQVSNWLFMYQEPQRSDRRDEWKLSPSSYFLQNIHLRPFLIRGKKNKKI